MVRGVSESDPGGCEHFRALAKALDRIGDRWAFLVVRDLMSGPKRFTDLMERMAGVTPKTLTRRLRDLEADGVIDVDRQPGRREVWYRLTAAGAELQPALDELVLWGLRNGAEPLGADEPVHPEHVLHAVQLQLRHERVDVGSVRWGVHVPGTGNYTIIGDGSRWDLRSDNGSGTVAAVTITAGRSALARFLTTPPPREHESDDVEIAGTSRAIRTFLTAIEVFPPGRVSAASSRDEDAETDVGSDVAPLA